MRTHLVLPALLAWALAPAVAGAQCPDRTTWPAPDWPDRTAETAASRAEAISALESYAFTLDGPDAERKGVRTDGVVILRGGELVYEHYARAHTAGTKHLTWSVTKSFTAALTGIAVREGRLSVGDSICAHLGGEAGCEVTVEDLLEFASGFDWREVYENQSNQASSVLAMLYGEGHADMASFVREHPLRDAPGTTFEYSTGDATLLAGVLGAAYADVGPDFPWTRLFDPLGITSATWERDLKGTLVGGSYLYLTPRDMARFGYLLLNDGCWEGERILPEGWVADSTKVSDVYRTGRRDPNETGVQGRMLWLNRAVPEQDVSQPWPNVPADAYAAEGHWGQTITVIPSLDLVVVRVADDRDGSFDLDRFLSLAIEVGRAP